MEILLKIQLEEIFKSNDNDINNFYDKRIYENFKPKIGWKISIDDYFLESDIQKMKEELKNHNRKWNNLGTVKDVTMYKDNPDSINSILVLFLTF